MSGGQDLNGPLEMDAARALDEGDVAGLEGLQKPATCGFGVGEKERGDSALAGCCRQMNGVALDGGDEIETGFGGSPATGGVQFRAMLTEFEHLAGDEDAAGGGTGGESANH